MSAIEEATKKREDFFAQFKDVIDTAVKFKKVMNKKGLKRARCVCPRCGKFIHASIASYNGHFRMSCEGQCGMAMME
jgi:ribosomal protein S27AE